MGFDFYFGVRSCPSLYLSHNFGRVPCYKNLFNGWDCQGMSGQEFLDKILVCIHHLESKGWTVVDWDEWANITDDCYYDINGKAIPNTIQKTGMRIQFTHKLY